MDSPQLLLGFSASFNEGAVVLVTPEEVIACTTIATKRDISKKIVPVAKELLAANGLDLREIGMFGADIGPGSFTGIRIALSVARSFAWLGQRPAVPVFSLDVLALSVARSSNAEYFAICLDAKRKSVYMAAFRNADIPVMITPPSLVELAKIPSVVRAGTQLVGDLPQELPFEYDASCVIRGVPAYSATDFAFLLQKKMVTTPIGDWNSLAPLYLRRAEAEDVWEEKQRKKLA